MKDTQYILNSVKSGCFLSVRILSGAQLRENVDLMPTSSSLCLIWALFSFESDVIFFSFMVLFE